MHEECFETRTVEILPKAECFSTLCYFAACQNVVVVYLAFVYKLL